MRSSPSPFWQKKAGPWHYTTVPAGTSWSEVGPRPQGDAITALRSFREVLRSGDEPRVQQQLALRFSIHIIQDLHQPLHVGNGRDRGGNDIRLRVNGRSSNLHRVWDSTILASRGDSDARWVARLTRNLADSSVLADCSADPEQWILGSIELREALYQELEEGSGALVLDGDYLARHLPAVERQLERAVVATACWLNQVMPLQQRDG